MASNITESIWHDVRAHAWKYAVRLGGEDDIDIVLLHSTRSGQLGYTTTNEYGATKNWFKSPNNRTTDSHGNVSAGMTNRIIGDRGKMCIVLPDNLYPRWSAGHMDPRAISIEIAQATNGTKYDPLDIERAEHEVAIICKQRDIPPRSIDFMSSDNRQAPGIAYHDASANGVYLGKSDTGQQPPFNNRRAWVDLRIAPRVAGIAVGGGVVLPSLGGEMFIAHVKNGELFGKPDGWKGSAWGVKSYRVNARADFRLPVEAKMIRMNVRLSPSSGRVVFGHGGGKGFADELRTESDVRPVEVTLDADGWFDMVVLDKTVTFELFDSSGYWKW